MDITAHVRQALTESGAKEATITVYCPHTTAGITINENADPDVKVDFMLGLAKAFPDRKEYLHAEGNSHAHLKASTVGFSQTVLACDGRLLLGMWQGIFFCEFDGPRKRKVIIKVKPD